MSTALALFALADLTPAADTSCGRCGNKPATTRVYAVQNLLGVHPTWLAPTVYQDATRTTHSAPCCEACAWQLGDAWWASWRTCPTGACALWAHTHTTPRPGWDCRRHHDETTVVWQEQLEVAA